jgi:hypothetical protein
MKAEIATLWADALESGEYLQGRCALKVQRADDSQTEYCCKGVLCDLAIKAGLTLEEEKDDGVSYFDGEWATLPSAVVEWAGIKGGPMPSVKISSELGSVELWTINDHLRYSFGQIASMIREHAEDI